jgi:endonuclease-3 related protein
MRCEERRELIGRWHRKLLNAYGPQHWWPADGPFEVIVGAILTQNTAWKNVKKAIAELKVREVLSPEGLHGLEQAELAELVRSSGYFNQKAKKLKIFCDYLIERWHGDLQRFLDRPVDELRPELLSLHGIGPETADSIVLYAAHAPSFVVDAYTRRIFSRHGLVPENIKYESLRDWFMDCLAPDVAFFQEFHALLVRTGHLHCRRSPRCEGCPLADNSAW